MRGCDGKLRYSEKERGKDWKGYMEKVANDENNWDHNVDGDAADDQVVCVSREEVLPASNEMETEKAPGPSGVSS